MKQAKWIVVVTLVVLSSMAAAQFGTAQAAQQKGHFQVTSTGFQNNTNLPLSAIYNYPINGANYCSYNGAAGGDQSPELSWTNAPSGTQSFAVIVFDVTAGVVHWGMYNIPPTTTELPQNAGAASSSYGLQVVNVFSDISYDGPCPPPGVKPLVHHYVFTVYALDKTLSLPGSANFPATALTLFRALVKPSISILARATITGLYSNNPPSE